MDYEKIVKEERLIARQKQSAASLSQVLDLNVVAPVAHISTSLRTEMRQVPSFDSSEPNAVANFSLNISATKDYRVGAVESVFYIPNAISPVQELQLMESISCSAPHGSNVWKYLKNRRLQSWGGNEENMEGLPAWLSDISVSLVKCGTFSASDKPNHVLINEYEAGSGIIHHTDGPVYRDTVAILSLESPCLMTFKHKLESHEIGHHGSDDVFSVLLQPRSILIFKEAVYTHFMHGIENVRSDTIGASAPCLNVAAAGLTIGEEVSISRLTPDAKFYGMIISKSTYVQQITRGKRTSLTFRKLVGAF